MKIDRLRKKCLAWALSLIMAFTCLPGAVPAEAAKTEKVQILKTTTYAQFDDETGELTISGEGEMGVIAVSSRPWKEGGTLGETCTPGAIKSITVEEGVTQVSSFSDMTNLTKVTLAESVTKIQGQTFKNDTSPDLVIDIKGAVTSWNKPSAFQGVTGKIIVHDRNTKEAIEKNSLLTPPATIELQEDVEALKAALAKLVSTKRNEYADKENDYSPDTWKALNDALDAADALSKKSDPEPTAQEIVAASKAITDAETALVTMRTWLNGQRTAWCATGSSILKTGEKSKFTDGSIAALQKAYDAAMAVQQVTDPVEEIRSKVDALIAAGTIDETGLAETGLKYHVLNSDEEWLRRDELTKENLVAERYTEESYAEYDTAWKALYATRTSSVSRQQLGKLCDAVEAAIEKLESVEIVLNAEGYQEAKKAVKAVLEAKDSPYTKNSLKALQQSYDFQVKGVEDESGEIGSGTIKDLLQSRLDQVVDTLRNLIDPDNAAYVLVKKGDLSKLKELVGSAGELDGSEYTESSWKDVESAVSVAEALIADPDNAGEPDIAAAEQALTEAMGYLEYRPADYSKVEQLCYETYPELDLSLYTEESVQALEAAIAAVDWDKNFTEQDVVDGYAEAIEKAIGALVLKEATSTEEPTEEPTASPSADPGNAPTDVPTGNPAASPTGEPVTSPTADPGSAPTDVPTGNPAASPTGEPVTSPTADPAASPTGEPVTSPTIDLGSAPTNAPAGEPTVVPTETPSAQATKKPDKGASQKKKVSVKKAALKKVASKTKKTLTIQWKKLSGVTGYQIVIGLDKKMKKGKKTVTIKKAKTAKTTVKKLKSKKKYFVKIRAYKTVSGKKHYGSWSAVKSVKVK